MNRTELDSYKRKLVAIQKVSEELLSATTELLSQIDKELNPEQETVKSVSHEKRYDTKRILIDSGFFTDEEIKADWKIIPTIQGFNLTEDQLKGTLKELLPKKDTMNNKAAFLTWYLKQK